ncbi:MAG: hypothetical protein AB7N76_15590 [Planctomycetota bacterium]
MSRFVQLSADGVTYRHGHREALDHLEESELAPGPDAAEALARAFLEALEGDQRGLRAGWVSVRWLREVDGAPRWDGPGYLYSFDTPGEVGDFALSSAGIDEEAWPLPPT